MGVRGRQADPLGDLGQGQVGGLGQHVEDRQGLLDGLHPVVLGGGERRGLAAAPHHGAPTSCADRPRARSARPDRGRRPGTAEAPRPGAPLVPLLPGRKALGGGLVVDRVGLDAQELGGLLGRQLDRRLGDRRGVRAPAPPAPAAGGPASSGRRRPRRRNLHSLPTRRAGSRPCRAARWTELRCMPSQSATSSMVRTGCAGSALIAGCAHTRSMPPSAVDVKPVWFAT